MTYDSLPAVNATLNASCAVLLVLGLAAVKLGRLGLHKALMVTALGVSVAFLACYFVHHAHLGGSKHFEGTGAARTLYFAILLTHTPLAAAVPFLAGRTAYLGYRNQLAKHTRLAWITLPIWLYVSVTGVAIYEMLYVLYPGAPHP